MATMAARQAGPEPRGAGHHVRRATVGAVVVLACAAIMVPFGLDALHDGAVPAHHRGAHAPRPPVVVGTTHHRAAGGVGPRGDLPALLPAARHLTNGARIPIGDITSGVLRRPAGGGSWQVFVRWNGRLQPLVTQGPVMLGDSTSRRSVTWLAGGQLYTRFPTARPGHYRVYAWLPVGGSAFAPPSLQTLFLGTVCFDRRFTTFGTCRARG